MFSNEVRLLFRKITRNKLFSAINIFGLTIGLTGCILAFLFIQDEERFDKKFTNTKDVYRLTINNDRAKTFHENQPIIFMDKILSDIPEVKSGLRILGNSVILKIDEHIFKENNFLFVDSNFFQFFGWSLISGNPQSALTLPHSLVISESKAQQFFQNQNPLGRTILVNNEKEYVITGVFKNFPNQSSIQSDYIGSITTLKQDNPDAYNSWGWHGSYIFLQLQNGTDCRSVNKKIATIWNNRSLDISCVGDFVTAKLQPFKEIYLKSGYLYNIPDNLSYIIGVAILAGFILIISCFNFINLFLAVNNKSTVETGIKKVMGANRKYFIRQVFLEVVFYIIAAIVISSLLVTYLLPYINNTITKNLHYSLFENLPLSLFLILISIAVTVITGIIPVLKITGSNTAGMLKRVALPSSGKRPVLLNQMQFQNVLVIAQFTIGILLIISAIMVNKQLTMIRHHDLGFNKEQILLINNQFGDRENRFKNLKNELSEYPEFNTIACGSNVPCNGLNNWGGATVKGEEEKVAKFCAFVSIDDKYFSTLNAEVLSGRDFNEQMSTDRKKIIINESMMKMLHLKDPVGKVLTQLWDNEREIIGVIKDLEYFSVRYPHIPTVYFFEDFHFGNPFDVIMIKLKSNDLSKSIITIKNHWAKISPDYPIDYTFMDEIFVNNYRGETQIAFFINVLTIVAVFLCGLGLFGLALFTINGKIKEIGVRKVNGAKVINIIFTLNKDFVQWVTIAFLISSPVAWYLIEKWLQKFVEKTEFNWWVLVLSGGIALFVALVTVSWQSWRAANKNPVEALRYE